MDKVKPINHGQAHPAYSYGLKHKIHTHKGGNKHDLF